MSNPRVWKEANALASIGHRVTIFTTAYSKNNFEADRHLLNKTIQYQASCNLIPSVFRIPHIVYAKGIKKIANLLFRLFNVTSIYQEVFLPKRQLSLIKRSKSNLMICHQETGLLLGVELIKMGFNVSFDFEDWYSEDYLHVNRSVSLLKNAEAYAFKYGKYITCPSVSMASALSKSYGINSEVNVIYNSFPLKNLLTKPRKKIPKSFVWFSQTIGPNRGIESFILALQKISTPLNLHFIGNCSRGFKEKLFALFQDSAHTLEIHPLLKHDELLLFLQQFEIGLALELDFPLNKKYTLSNKILLYLQLNINVIATATEGQLELKDKFKDRITYISLDDKKDIIDKVAELLNQRIYSMDNLFTEEYSWETQQKTIDILVNKAVKV